MAKKQTKPVEEPKVISPWWLLLPLTIGIAILWLGFYFTFVTTGTWMQMPTVITAGSLLFVDGIVFFVLLNIVSG